MMFGSSHCQPVNIINLWRAVSVIHLMYNSSINIGVTANKNMFINNVQTLSGNRKIKDDHKHVKNYKEELCKMILKMASKKKTPDWTMEQLETVLNYLKKNKSRDPFGYANDLFQVEVAGDDLKKAVLMLLNRSKKEQIYPEVLEDCDISSIYKNRGATKLL